MDTTEKSLASPSLLHPHQYVYTLVRSHEPSLAQMCSFFSFTSSSLSHLISLSPNIPPNIKPSKQLFPLPVTMGAFLLSNVVTRHIRLLLEDTGSLATKGFLQRSPHPPPHLQQSLTSLFTSAEEDILPWGPPEASKPLSLVRPFGWSEPGSIPAMGRDPWWERVREV